MWYLCTLTFSAIGNLKSNMTPRISHFQRNLIVSMLEAGHFSDFAIAKAAHTTDRSIWSIRCNIRIFEQASAPVNKPGHPADLTKEIIEALLHHLYEKPELYLEEMAWFIWDEFKVVTSISSISKALHEVRWSKKQVRLSSITG